MNEEEKEQQALIHAHELRIQQHEFTIEKLEDRLFQHENVLKSLNCKSTLECDDDRVATPSSAESVNNTKNGLRGRKK